MKWPPLPPPPPNNIWWLSLSSPMPLFTKQIWVVPTSESCQSFHWSRQSRIIEYTLWIQDSWYWIRDSLSVELEFQIPCAEYSVFHRKDFQGSWFYKQKLPRFQNPAYLTCYESLLSHLSFDCDNEMLMFFIKSKFKRIGSKFFNIWIQNTALKCCSF